MEQGGDKSLDLDWVLEKIGAKKAAPKPTPAATAASKEKKKADLVVTQQKELELWKTWKDSGHKPEHLDPLLKSLNPLIQREASKWKRTEVPTAAIDFEHKKQVVQALKKYDPTRGVKLSTWISNNILHAGRMVQSNQNFARISEPIIRKIGTFNAVKADLTERLGHEPDTDTLHEALMKKGFSKRDVVRLNKEQRKGLIASGSDDNAFGTVVGNDPNEQVIQLIYFQLSPEERKVHELTFGLNGNPKLRPGDIAKRLKMDNSKVAKLRTSITKKMEPYLRMGHV